MKTHAEAIDTPATVNLTAGDKHAAPVAGRLRHAGAVIVSHWVSVLLVSLAAVTVLSRELIEDRTWRVLLLEAHRQSGLLVLAALVVRLVLRVRKGMADTAGDMHPLLRMAAAATHWGLYALLLAIPLLGWALTNAHETPLRLFGVLPLPALVAPDSDLADTLTDRHILFSWVLLAAVSAHVLAALWHHFVRRDQVLAAMLPRAGRGEPGKAGEKRPLRAAA